MYVKIEPSGICERKGMVQVRFCMYLEPTDYGYEKHHVQVSVIPPGGYPGKVDKQGNPVDQKVYDKWVGSLQKVWQNNPFHNHFIQVEPDIVDTEILDMGMECLKEAYTDWASNKTPSPKNKLFTPPVITAARIAVCKARVQSVKQITTEVRV